MVLDLVDRGGHLGGLQEDVQVLLGEVADTDAARFARGLDGLHLRPLHLQLLFVAVSEERRVDQVQVDVVQAEFLERGRKAVLDGAVGPGDLGALGDYVEPLAWHAGLFDGLPEFLLVAVAVGAVEVEVSLWNVSCVGGGVGITMVVGVLVRDGTGESGFALAYTFDSLDSVGNSFLINLSYHVLGLEVRGSKTVTQLTIVLVSLRVPWGNGFLVGKVHIGLTIGIS